MKYYLGIDLGGTFIKCGVVSEDGKILIKDKTPTEVEGGEGRVVENIARLANSLIEQSGISRSDFVGAGIGIPGIVDSATGEVIFATNLGWEHFNISKALGEKLGLPVKPGNDANLAALGETKFGCGKNYNSTIMITLGTGVGGGIIIDGKLIEGNKGAGAELGHSVIVAGGEPCGCGRRGCFESYASATALIRDTRRAMQAHPESKMWEVGSLEEVNGKTPFDFADCDKYAKEVVDNYIEKLACGLLNYANALRPEAIILGGGVCAQGETLLNPVKKLFNKEIFAGSRAPAVDIVIATLGNDAGTLGAAALFMD